MFPLHDRTRRRIALTAFGAFCALPTLLILLWGFSRQMPWHTGAEVRRLEAALGLRVRVDRAWNTQPGVWRYDGFSLDDPETGQRLLQCEQIEVHYTGRGSSAPATLVLHARRPVANEAGATALYRLLSRAMQGQMGRAPLDWQWTAEEFALGEGPAVVHLAGLSGGAQSHPGGVKAQLRFRLAGGDETEPAHVELFRNRLTSPAGLELKLDTGATPLPCHLLAAGLPAFRSLGPHGQFRGYLRADQTSHGWRGELTGHFAGVDLGHLVRERFAQQLTGVGEVTIERARFDGSRVEEASGSIAVGPGTIGRRLLDAAVEQMRLIRSAPPTEGDDPVPYRQLAASWRIHAGGLRIEGRCLSSGPGTLLAGTEPWQVGEPIVQPVPVASLVRTLVCDEPVEVPAAPQAAWLLRHLPLPETARDAADRRTAERLR